jgi:hypothetical protein
LPVNNRQDTGAQNFTSTYEVCSHRRPGRAGARGFGAATLLFHARMPYRTVQDNNISVLDIAGKRKLSSVDGSAGSSDYP